MRQIIIDFGSRKVEVVLWELRVSFLWDGSFVLGFVCHGKVFLCSKFTVVFLRLFVLI